MFSGLVPVPSDHDVHVGVAYESTVWIVSAWQVTADLWLAAETPRSPRGFNCAACWVTANRWLAAETHRTQGFLVNAKKVFVRRTRKDTLQYCTCAGTFGVGSHIFAQHREKKHFPDLRTGKRRYYCRGFWDIEINGGKCSQQCRRNPVGCAHGAVCL